MGGLSPSEDKNVDFPRWDSCEGHEVLVPADAFDTTSSTPPIDIGLFLSYIFKEKGDQISRTL